MIEFLIIFFIIGIIVMAIQALVYAFPFIVIGIVIIWSYPKIKKIIIDYRCDKYFKSECFKNIKEKYEKYISDFNELNYYIEGLKDISIYFTKTNYGQAIYNDNNSNYNYNRPELNNIKYLDNIYDCSLSVLNNARMQPFKYLCKYFHFQKNKETLKIFEEILNKYLSVDEGKQILESQKENLLKEIDNVIPNIVKTHQPNRITRELGFSDFDFSDSHFPVFTFRYISPGGNSRQSECITLDNTQLENFIFYLSEEIKFQETIKGQRALMTKTLRNKIKARDNYTCCECGNSVYKEKNLLLEIDHKTPLSKGGMSTEDNLQTLCWKCNRRKGSKIYY